VGQFSLLWIDQMQRLNFDVDVVDSEWGAGANLDVLQVCRPCKGHKRKFSENKVADLEFRYEGGTGYLEDWGLQQVFTIEH
jgi:hypothetical protein